MHDSQQSMDSLARSIETLAAEVKHLYEEMELLKMRIPRCPCGNTMVSMEIENFK
jgi:prefoldin subunit 5